MSERFDTFGPPAAEPDPWEATAAETVDADEGEELDPRTAAALLEQTTQQARYQMDVRTPLLMVIAAAVVLIVYGALWQSVRGQHPYVGPTGTALGILYGTLAIWVVIAAASRRRRRGGIGGRSRRQQQIAGVAFGITWTCVYVFQGALHHAGAGHAIVYGIYPAVAPLIVIGGAAAAYGAAQENWSVVGPSLAAVALGAGGAFAGPANVWGVIGLGLCVLLLAYAATLAWLRRART